MFSLQSSNPVHEGPEPVWDEGGAQVNYTVSCLTLSSATCLGCHHLSSFCFSAISLSSLLPSLFFNKTKERYLLRFRGARSLGTQG